MSVVSLWLWAAVATVSFSQHEATPFSGTSGHVVSQWSEWAAWSACSTTCGPGLAKRLRQCSHPVYLEMDRESNEWNCTGKSSQLKICTLQPCPPGQPGLRERACSEYNTKLFAASRYQWEPFIHPTDSCKLTCRVQGRNLYANLADKVPDGTPCPGLNSVCVNGVCQRAGCDGVVGSVVHLDKCGVCQGNGESCKTVSGIFTSTELRRGLNHVITIPAGSTTINITELQPSRNLLLFQTVAGKTFISEGGRSPASGDVTAAGTVFSYGMKSASEPLKRLSAPGPINVTVVLKLLSRGKNPGIMYSFNVPLSVGGDFLREITLPEPPQQPRPLLTHTSASTLAPPHPGEIGPDHTHHDPQTYLKASSVQEKSGVQERLSEKRYQNTMASSADFKMRGDSRGLLRKKTQTIEEGPLPVGRPTDRPQDLLADAPTVPAVNTHVMSGRAMDQVPGEVGLRQAGSSLVADSASPDIGSRNRQLHLQNIQNTASVDHSNGNADDENDKDYDRENGDDDDYYYDLDDNNGGSIDGDSSRSNHENGKVAQDFENIMVSDEQSREEIGIMSKEIQEVMKDHTLVQDASKSYSEEDLAYGGHTRKSVSIPLNSLMDPNEIEGWNPNNEIYKPFSGELDGYNGLDNGRDLSQSKEMGVEHSANVDISHSSKKTGENAKTASIKTAVAQGVNSQNREKIFNTENINRDRFLNQDNQYKDRNKHNSNVQKSSAFSRYPIALEGNSTLQIPKYSQSFTFAERYKNIYSRRTANTDRNRHRVNSARHQRRHEGKSQSSEDFTDRRKRLLSRRRHFRGDVDPATSATSAESRRAVRVRQQTLNRRNLNAGRGETISALRVVQPLGHEDSAQDRGTERAEHESRAPRPLHDREWLIQDRNRRLREQRYKYKQRLREYQEKLQQRRAGNVSARERDLPSRIILRDHQATSNRNAGDKLTRPDKPSRLGQVPELSFPPSPVLTSERVRTRGELYTVSASRSVSKKPILSSIGNKTDENNKYEFKADKLGNSTYKSRNLSFVKPPEDKTSVIKEDYEDKFQGIYSLNSQENMPSGVRPSNTHVPHIIPAPRQQTSDIRDIDQLSSAVVNAPEGVISSHNEELRVPDISVDTRYDPSLPLHPQHISTLTGTNDAPPGSADQLLIPKQIPANDVLPKVLTSASDHLSGRVLPDQIPRNTLTAEQVSRNAAYEWRISGLTECTHSCGGGVQQTMVICVDTMTQATVTNENCGHFKKPQTQAVTCSTRPCPAMWTPSSWSPCTVSCGEGEQSRTVACQARVSPTLNLTVSEEKCQDQERIPTVQKCILRPCSSWRVDKNWTECSVQCGEGVRKREVVCVDQDNAVISDEACLSLKPDDEEICNMGECGKGWFFTSWPLQCPAQCGSGMLTRQIFCADEKGLSLPDSRCDVTKQPPTTQTCKASKPCGGVWFTGLWSECDTLCGPGNRSRDVLCIKTLPGDVFAVVDEENCEEEAKPEGKAPCQMEACTSQWYMTSWSQCSKSCGTGYRLREVKCLSHDQQPSDRCPLDERPKTRGTCNTQHCISGSAEKDEVSTCKDTFTHCKVVQRARLCGYKYYKSVCCQSCSTSDIGH